MRIDSIKMEKLSQKALERKSNKPIMEKKRRARINQCLNQLKSLILETDNERSRHSKLEKADILEMTVKYLQTLRAYHVHLQQIHQLQQQTSHQLHNFQLQQQLASPSEPGAGANTNLAHQATKLAASTGSSSAPLSPAMSPNQLNLQLSPSLALPLQLNAHTMSPTQLSQQALQDLHLNRSHLHLNLSHHHQRHPLSLAHTAQQISPTAWRPW